MSSEVLPTAEGDLGRTPFAHLLVYAGDQQLTGALFLHVPDGVMHSVRLECGRPVKVQMGDAFARLGQLMVEAGIIDMQTHDLPRIVPGLIGESLVAGGHITREILDKMVEHQFFVRMTRLFSLPPTTRYAYFGDMHEIIDDGAPLSAVHPLAVIWAGLRTHATASVMMAPVLERIGDAPLRLHHQAAIDRLRPTPAERAVLDQLREQQTLSKLVETNSEDEPTLRRMVYALVILRFIDFGTEALPLFPEKTTIPPASTTSVTLARIRLQQNAPRRFMAAAPDDVGDGERIRPQPRTRKRPRPSSPSAAPESSPKPKKASKSSPKNPAVDDAPVALEATSNAPRDAHAMFDLALKRLADGDRQGAFHACQQAREIDPDQPDYAVLATWIRAILGGSNLEACVCDLDKLLESCPDHVPALFYRGYLRRRTGDESGAVTDLHRVLELDPTHEDAKRELKRIERRSPPKRPSGLYQS